jgi:hypothetical protein
LLGAANLLTVSQRGVGAATPVRSLTFRLPDHFETDEQLDIAWSAPSFCLRRTEMVVAGGKLRPFLSKLSARVFLVAHTAREVAHGRATRYGGAVGGSFAGRLDVEARRTVNRS